MAFLSFATVAMAFASSRPSGLVTWRRAGATFFFATGRFAGGRFAVRALRAGAFFARAGAFLAGATGFFAGFFFAAGFFFGSARLRVVFFFAAMGGVAYHPLMQKITTFLWFDGAAEEAASFYTSLFPDSRITTRTRGPDGKPLTVAFQLAGQDFVALNGGPRFKFTEAMSLLVNCETQAELDRLWAALTSNGGQESMCGWLKDRWGVSWQLVPVGLGKMMSDPDPAKSGRMMQAMLGMKKLDLAELERAFEGR